MKIGKENVRQELFTLTNDMVPIHFSDFEAPGISFVCPLPKGFQKVITKKNDSLMREVALMVKDINSGKVLLRKSPFKNILLGFPQKTIAEKENARLKVSMTKRGEVDSLKFFLAGGEEFDLLQTFQITDIQTDKEKGVTSVFVRKDEKGDHGGVALITDVSEYYEAATLGPIAFLFEPNFAFMPHTVFPKLRNYGEALLAREFCVRYFNILNMFLCW